MASVDVMSCTAVRAKSRALIARSRSALVAFSDLCKAPLVDSKFLLFSLTCTAYASVPITITEAAMMSAATVGLRRTNLLRRLHQLGGTARIGSPLRYRLRSSARADADA